MPTITKAGKKALEDFLDAERNTTERLIGAKLVEIRCGDVSLGLAREITRGDGARIAAVRKLDGDGLAIFHRVTQGHKHFYQITAAGRAAIADESV